MFTQGATTGIWLIFALLCILVLRLAIESYRHKQRLKKIPYRIHVNGTRGKSSVTRLIAAGLRAGGIKTCAKTTGTMPRFIHLDGEESPIYRRRHTNVIEQVKVIKDAVKEGAEALVIECMAVQPLLQSLCERQLVCSTHGVLCNARADHLDVMGPTEHDVALALAGTMTIKGKFFTTEEKYLPVFQEAATDRNTQLTAIDSQEVALVTKEDMQGFAYNEHRVNVALALKICAELGVDKTTALKGMWDAKPDPGAMTHYTLTHNEHQLTFVNGFAANDPISTTELWHKLITEMPSHEEHIALVNCRADRSDRTKQLVDVINDWQSLDRIVTVGSGVDAFTKPMQSKAPHISIANGEDLEVKALLDKITQQSEKRSHLIIGVCNIAGIGFELVEYFRTHEEKTHD